MSNYLLWGKLRNMYDERTGKWLDYDPTTGSQIASETDHLAGGRYYLGGYLQCIRLNDRAIGLCRFESESAACSGFEQYLYSCWQSPHSWNDYKG